jgi:hypothetical protein
VTVAQFLGGWTGATVGALLEAMGVRALTQAVEAPTRTCTSLVSASQDGNAVTEVVEPGDEVGRWLCVRVCVCVRACVCGGGAGGVCFGAEVVCVGRCLCLRRRRCLASWGRSGGRWTGWQSWAACPRASGQGSTLR